MATTTKKASSKLKARCAWAGDDETYVAYHDGEWGVPVYDDQRLFEKISCSLQFSTCLSNRV